MGMGFSVGRYWDDLVGYRYLFFLSKGKKKTVYIFIRLRSAMRIRNLKIISSGIFRSDP